MKTLTLATLALSLTACGAEAAISSEAAQVRDTLIEQVKADPAALNNLAVEHGNRIISVAKSASECIQQVRYKGTFTGPDCRDYHTTVTDDNAMGVMYLFVWFYDRIERDANMTAKHITKRVDEVSGRANWFRNSNIIIERSR